MVIRSELNSGKSLLTNTVLTQPEPNVVIPISNSKESMFNTTKQPEDAKSLVQS